MTCSLRMFSRILIIEGAQNHSGLTYQRASVLFQPYLLQVMYKTFQYLTVLCIPAVEYVPNISRQDLTFIDR